MQQCMAECHSWCVESCEAGLTIALLPAGALAGALQCLNHLLKPTLACCLVLA